MIFPKDLQLGIVLCSYMLYGGYPSTLHTDALTFAHVLRRTLDDLTVQNTIQKASHLLDSIFLLALKPGTVLSPSDLRLYIRIFVGSRLPPVINLWNNCKPVSFDSYASPFDVVSSDTASTNEMYMYFSNVNGFIEKDYVASPTDCLKMIMFRRTPEVRTFTNAEAGSLHKVVLTGHTVDYYTEVNGFPLKYYTQNELDPETRVLLSGKYAIRAL
jgi:hypothetical protein